ncbi:MAG TPA: DUF6230 family protein [Trebonia sp.]|jgi:hypothetical protein|nr:DUF6230 family protein [Trebonia sp.]
MSVDNSSRGPAQGRVRWRRFAIAAVPAVAVAGVLIGLTAEGAIASSFSVSGAEYTVTASQLSGSGFVQFGTALPQGNKQVPVIESGIASARLTNLCQSVSVPLFGTIRLTAGDAGTPASASNLIVDAQSQTGSQAVFKNITIGQDASTLNEDGATTGQAGSFGEQASGITIDNLVQNTWLTTAGTFTLPNLSLGFGSSCP